MNEETYIPRQRATQYEMEQRARFLIEYAVQHGPVTVRQLYYQAEIAGIPGIDKTQSGYNKIQQQVLKLRREGRLAYEHIADATRWMRKPTSYASIEDALQQTVRTYRRNLWRDTKSYVEVWIEKDALAGVVYQVTEEYDVPLMVTRGFSSETFAYEAVAAREGDPRDYHVYYFGDFDRAGQDASNSLHRKLLRFAQEADYDLNVHFYEVAVTEEQVHGFSLSTRPPKRESAADKTWPYDYCCEVDAIDPDTLREMVRVNIEVHLPREQLERLKNIEQAERESFMAMMRIWRRSSSSQS